MGVVCAYVLSAILAAHLAAAVPVITGESLVIDPRVRSAVAGGRVRVLLELRVTGGVTPEGNLPSADAVSGQRRAIRAAQQGVIARLTGTGFSVSRQYASVPLLALEIGADVLAALELMGDLVARVSADEPRAPGGARP